MGGFDINVKGSIYLTGKTTIISVFGEERWNSFIPKLTAKDNFFSNPIMSITRVPVEKFILFLDELVKEFFNNDMMQYVTFGKVAAQFGLSPEGMYKSYLLTKDTKQFVESVMPKLWSTYFDEGIVTALFENNVLISKSPAFKSNIFTLSNSLWVTFRRPSKFLGRKMLRKKSEAFHRAMMIFISSLD